MYVRYLSLFLWPSLLIKHLFAQAYHELRDRRNGTVGLYGKPEKYLHDERNPNYFQEGMLGS